jgi:hypothetical protein
MSDVKLDPEEILELEFGYARETAAQAQNDRTAIVNLYLILVGGTGSVIGALMQLSGTDELRNAFALALFLLGVIGFFTVFKLIRLRQAWHESVRAMNTIKKFYLERFPDLDTAVLWKPNSIPAPGKLWTISFNLAVLVAIIDSVAMMLTAHLVDWHPFIGYLSELFIGIVFFVAQIGFYLFQLRTPEK